MEAVLECPKASLTIFGCTAASRAWSHRRAAGHAAAARVAEPPNESVPVRESDQAGRLTVTAVDHEVEVRPCFA